MKLKLITIGALLVISSNLLGANEASHEYYLGKDSGATHYWHGLNKDVVWHPNGENLAYTKESEYIANELTEHSRKMDQGIFQVKKDFYVAYGYGLTSPTMIVGDSGIVVIDPPESVEKMEKAMKEFREVSKSNLPIAAVLYTHWHADHYAGVKGVISQEDADTGVAVIAHETFMSNVIKGSAGGTGPILGARVDYSLGTLMEVDEKGRINGGLGPDFEIKEHSLIAPNKLIKDRAIVNYGGVEMEIVHTPSEASDELIIWFPEYKLLHAAEVIQGESYPNLHSIRGTQYRNPETWFKGLDSMRDFPAEAMIVAHGRPVIGVEEVANTITTYRDAVQYTYDQTIRRMNMGETPEELIRTVTLPEEFADHPWLGDFYGSIRHAVKQIYVGELGWFEGDPTFLNPTLSSEASARLIELIGSEEKVFDAAEVAIEAKDFQWGAELLTHILKVNPYNEKARLMKAEALREIAYNESNNNWRNWYLTSAQELDGSIDFSKKIDLQAPDLIAVFPAVELLESLRFSIDPEKARGKSVAVAFEIEGSVHTLEVRNSVLDVQRGEIKNPDVLIKLDKSTLLGLLGKQIDLDSSIDNGLVDVVGEKSALAKFFSCFDTKTYEVVLTARDLEYLED